MKSMSSESSERLCRKKESKKTDEVAQRFKAHSE